LTQEQVHPFIQLINNNWNDTGAWPEFIEAMRLVLPVGKVGAEPDKEISRWVHLPGLCCQAAGGTPDLTNEVAAAWLLLYTAAHLIDNVEDMDLAEEVNALGGPGPAINVTNGLFLSAALMLNKFHEKVQKRNLASQISSDFYNTILIMTSGQHLDIANQQLTLEQWWQVAEAKSGSFFSLACRSGAKIGNNDLDKIKGYSDFGFHLGMMIQIIDDLEDLASVINHEETGFTVGFEKSLAVAYALEVLPEADKGQFMDWSLAAPREPDIVNGIIDILNQCGAGLYMLSESERHRNLALRSLEAACPSSPAGEKLSEYLRELGLE
jgi:geranylgeranyl pyrophosphate synthase